jgi:hypothetical protein
LEGGVNGMIESLKSLNKTQPEKVILFNEPITIRSNWDLELKWDK